MTITAPRPSPYSAPNDRSSSGTQFNLSSGPLPGRHPRRWKRFVARLVADRSHLEVGLVLVLLGLTAAAYLWDLSASGYANSFYAAAVEAGTRSWKAFFFGSLDSSNFITVDKPPASLWLMDLSGRLFGFSSWSMLVPEALLGVGTVALVYATVRRWCGAAAGIISGAVMAITPVAALMFRFNNPDALLVMLLTAGAYCVTRAIEKASAKWLMLAGAMVGFAFLAKMGEALLVVPAFALAYLVAAPASLTRRALHLLAAGAAVMVSAGWWVLTVSLWPVGSRPMIDGSPTNSIWNLIIGYNGLSRLEGSGANGGGNFSGATGAFRLFNALMGGQASWLLPAAMVVLVGGLILTVRAPRTDRARAALILWGGWLLTAGTVFSFSQGTIHTYYTVALAPPIAALVGIGAYLLWRSRYRHAWWARAVAGVVTLGTAAWAIALLDRSPSWYPWLRPFIAGAAVVAVAGLALGVPGRCWTARGAARANEAGQVHRSRVWRKPVGAVGVGAMAMACSAGPVAYSLQTVSTAHAGSIVSAGPATSATLGTGGPGGGFTGGGFTGGRFTGGRFTGGGFTGGGFTGGGFRGGSGGGGDGFPGGKPGKGTHPSGAQGGEVGAGGEIGAGAGAGPGALADGGTGVGSGVGTGAGADGTQVTSALVKALESDAGRYRWVAATDGSQNAATLELATGGDPVMAIGGFNNNGGNITLATFERYVKEGLVHYYIAGQGVGGGPGGQQSSRSTITAWVESNFHSETVGGETVYDLASSSSH